jgi:hypothetical protein
LLNSLYRRIAPRHATAFRRNQQRVQDRGRQVSHHRRDSALRAGHLSQANEPISPLRKQKPRNRIGSFAGPGAIAARKRIGTVTKG